MRPGGRCGHGYRYGQASAPGKAATFSRPTFFLAFAVFGTAVDPNGPKIGGLGVGFVVTADILVIGPLTGASMNPARSFGPAVASGVYEAQLLYWFAPITGAVVASLLYEFLFMRRGREPVDHGELRP